MKFGKVTNPEDIDFSLPADHPATQRVFNASGKTSEKPVIYIGCAKWNKQDLKNFYPRGTKDELVYYASQFNSIEMNSTFYRIFPPEQYEKWKEKVPADFRFFPKVSQDISHFRQLNDVDEILDRYLYATSHFGEKLGTCFLQLHERFGPKNMDRLERFIERWPIDVRLSVELRHADWYADPAVSEHLYQLLESKGISNTLVDTAGRRDLLHMRMTTPRPFVRYVGSNHSSDYQRLDEWVNRIDAWAKQGMTELHFFVHQNIEEESPLLSAYLIEQLNAKLGIQLHVPQTLSGQRGLF